jgi:hypothetical protein
MEMSVEIRTLIDQLLEKIMALEEGGGFPSASIGQGQFEQQPAAFERWPWQEASDYG